VSNGDQVNRVAALALKRGKSVDFTGSGTEKLNYAPTATATSGQIQQPRAVRSLCSQLNIQASQLIGKIGWLPLRGN
jgi:hypothetical protein